MADQYLLAAVRDLLAEYDETGEVTAIEIEGLRAMLYSYDLKTIPGMKERIIEQKKTHQADTVQPVWQRR